MICSLLVLLLIPFLIAISNVFKKIIDPILGTVQINLIYKLDIKVEKFIYCSDESEQKEAESVSVYQEISAYQFAATSPRPIAEDKAPAYPAVVER